VAQNFNLCTDLSMNPDRTLNTRPVWRTLFTGQNRPPKTVGVNMRFQAIWASQPMGCLLVFDVVRRWRGIAIVSAKDLRFTGCGFEYWLGIIA